MRTATYRDGILPRQIRAATVRGRATAHPAGHCPLADARGSARRHLTNYHDTMQSSIRRFVRAMIWLCPLLLAGCAKVGDPHPPAVVVPLPATDLQARQYSDQVLLTVTMPERNTDGSLIAAPGSIQVLRRVEAGPAADAALSEADFVNGATVIVSVRADQIKDYLTNKSLTFRDPLYFPDRAVIYTQGYRYAVRFLNRKKQSGGLSNQVYVAPVSIPPPPRDLSAEVRQDLILVRWQAPDQNLDGSQPPRVEGYKIYRSEDPGNFPSAPLNSEPVRKTEFEDRTFQFDKTYYYSVSVVASRANPYAESLASPALTVSPRDTFPPGAPQNLNGVVTDGTVLLLWAAPQDNDIVGYRIYRREAESESPRILQTELVSSLSYRDEAVPKGKRLEYRVAAVDSHGNEGPAAQTWLEAP